MPADRPTDAADPAAGTPAPRRQLVASLSSVWFDAQWRAWLLVGPDDSPDAFRRTARLLQKDFGGLVTNTPARVADQEQAEVRVGAARLLLARKAGVGVTLGAEWADVSTLLRIAESYKAVGKGRRWHAYRLGRRLGFL